VVVRVAGGGAEFGASFGGAEGGCGGERGKEGRGVGCEAVVGRGREAGRRERVARDSDLTYGVACLPLGFWGGGWASGTKVLEGWSLPRRYRRGVRWVGGLMGGGSGVWDRLFIDREGGGTSIVSGKVGEGEGKKGWGGG